jgi:hypothetical protein
MATQRHHRASIILATTAALLAGGAVPAQAATTVSKAHVASAGAHTSAVRKAALAHRRSVTRASFLRTADAAVAPVAPAAAPVVPAEVPAAVPVVSVPAVSAPAASTPVVTTPAVSTPAVTTSPSGVALPVGDLPGWKQIVAEDFSGSTIPAGWGTYEGTPGGEPNGQWLNSHATVGNNVLTLAGSQVGSKFATGGIMAAGPSVGGLTYGKYNVRFRINKGHGVKYAALLWPKNENWPVDGEIDFAEDGGGNRDGLTGTVHYGADNSQIQRDLTGDFSTWNTLGVEWTPSKIVYTLNDKPWATVTGSAVPHTAMNLALQTQAGTCGSWVGASCPDSTTPTHVDLQVDWVTEYAYTG